jgi:peptidoglycan hydrolase-like protein with peptidoglycan-binding domain
MASPSSEPAPTDEPDAPALAATPPAESASAGSAERDGASTTPAKTTTPAEPEPAAEDTAATVEPEPPTLQPIDDPVATAQRELNARGYNAGPVDGIYGPKTRTALLAFQEEHDLEQTGRPDPDTLEAMGFRMR